MVIRITTEAEFFSTFPSPRDVYSSQAFVGCNRHRAEAVRFFVGYDDDVPRLGIILGYRQGEWSCPFSAPFGSLAYNRPQSIEHIYDFISELTDMLEENALSITLPPQFYDDEMLAAAHGVFANHAHKVAWDYNFHYDLSDLGDFTRLMDASARKNYHQALEAGFAFAQTADMERAYAVIHANRESKGRDLSMSLEQVEHTVKPVGPVDADFFILSHGGADVAAAMVYHVAPAIAQVVYWGDAPGYSAMRPMNLLPFRLFEHYRDLGFKIVDVGPASVRGIPNSGLVRFKKSLGCRLALKPTFIWD